MIPLTPTPDPRPPEGGIDASVLQDRALESLRETEPKGELPQAARELSSG
jgi:hypothetical protein